MPVSIIPIMINIVSACFLAAKIVLNVKMDIIVRLLSITETEYYYLKALNLVDSDVYDETINEPLRYPSNVHGGTGMVSISTEVSQTVRIRENTPE